jgi:hypothetical protein
MMMMKECTQTTRDTSRRAALPPQHTIHLWSGTQATPFRDNTPPPPPSDIRAMSERPPRVLLLLLENNTTFLCCVFGGDARRTTIPQHLLSLERHHPA